MRHQQGGTDVAKKLSSIETNRRKFIIGTGSVFAAGIMTRAASLDALAQDATTGRLFFNPAQANAIDALAEVMWPETEDSAGGREAGVMYYIDRAVAGPYSDFQPAYTAGLEWLDFASLQAHGNGFAELEFDQQVDVVTQVFEGGLGSISGADVSRSGHAIISTAGSEATPEAGGSATPVQATPTVDAEATPESVEPDDAEATQQERFIDGVLVPGTSPSNVPDLRAFLDIVRVHVMEGLFSDPAHGGNRDYAGWAAVGYPGPYIVFNEEQQQSFEPLDLPFQSIADL